MPSRPLSADRTLEVRLHTRAGTLASAVARGVTTRGQAVAALSLIAPCRPELTERVLARIGSIPPAEVEWPPRSVQVALLASSFRVTQGTVRLSGPGGMTVQHVTYTDKLGYTRRVLRLARHGVLVGDCRTVEELGRHVDVDTLREDGGEAGSEADGQDGR
jgi:thioesterase domain-containing protein